MYGLIAATASLASAHDRGWHHGGWWILWLLAWALVLAVIVTVVWRSRRPPPRDGHTAKTILAERYAKGEINATEYRERLHTLQDTESS